MSHHRFITCASVVLVAWLAGATYAESATPSTAARAQQSGRVVLELSGMG